MVAANAVRMAAGMAARWAIQRPAQGGPGERRRSLPPESPANMLGHMTSNFAEQFFQKGWVRFPADPEIAAWASAALPVARSCISDPDHQARWLRCGGTWFVGVSVLPNDADAALPDHGVPPLRGAPVDFIAEALGFSDFAWDAGQVSACFPGYPRPSEEESEAAFRFRRNRDAAHVDGLLRFDGRRRRLGERHGFILGLPLTNHAPAAAPFIVWEGSHEVMRKALRERLAGIAPENWAAEDVTDAYIGARREAFKTCRRVAVHAPPGSAYLVHRLALHGVAPWPMDRPDEVSAGTGQAEGSDARIIVYFRPDPFPDGSPEWWLENR